MSNVTTNWDKEFQQPRQRDHGYRYNIQIVSPIFPRLSAEIRITHKLYMHSDIKL